MSTLETWLIILLILGVIASNLAVLKYSSKFKLSQFGQHNKGKQIKSETVDPSTTDDNASVSSNKPSSTDLDPNKTDQT